MKRYRFSKSMARAGYRGVCGLLLAIFLFSPLAAAQAAPPWPEEEEPALEQAQPAATATPGAAAAPLPAVSCAKLHEYQRGESLAQIAARYSLTVKELKAANTWLAYMPLQGECQLCIPFAGVIDKHAKAELYAYLILGHLTVYGRGFPKNTRYNVRVLANRSDVWYKIDHVRSGKDGVILDYTKLPKEIRYPRQLKVCLKEIDTGWLICTMAEVIRF